MSETDDLRTLLDEWKALEAAATPGPWFADGNCLMHDVRDTDLDHGYRVSLLNGTDGVSVPGWCEHTADAEFIAASRTIVPRLIAAVEAAAPLIAAQALRDAADGYQTGGWADDLPTGGSRPALILGMSQRAVAWLRTRADRIEQGGQP